MLLPPSHQDSLGIGAENITTSGVQTDLLFSRLRPKGGGGVTYGTGRCTENELWPFYSV